MPFGLKNAGATYQRLIDKTFQHQIGRNVEAYVDDIVIKSHEENAMITDIQETFNTLRGINMKLNPSKCSFGMEKGKFLGHIVTVRGIKANPKKIEAVVDMPSPKTKKQGCLRKQDFSWTEEAEKAFQDMKKFLADLPTLTTPIPEETLTLYLGASKECVRAVLLAERGSSQMPIYFVSRALKDKPIKQVLSKPEVSGRLAKWAIELGEHEITFQSRNAKKGQILADFLAEVDGEEEEVSKVEENPPWTLFTDGASSVGGSGAGLILIDPEKKEYTYALRFDFLASNNKAKYEALLAGLRIARKMGVEKIHAYVDSQLVANQIKGAFEASQKTMQLYLEEARKIIFEFKKFNIEQVPRSQNKKADALSKLTSLTFAHLTKEVLVEVLEEKSIVPKKEVSQTEEAECWMTPLYNFIKDGTLPEDKESARKTRMKAPMYLIMEGSLFRKSFLGPHLRCVGPLQAKELIQEVHGGTCGIHAGPRS
uniref:uncharacterized protein LOC122591233 n=1 Tax=Erigeron canadensis TaxID=72917 RepID=UPI001CB88D94|nr:uncharacterized protein LOC122591233 [Erigeron canadensis]